MTGEDLLRCRRRTAVCDEMVKADETDETQQTMFISLAAVTKIKNRKSIHNVHL